MPKMEMQCEWQGLDQAFEALERQLVIGVRKLAGEMWDLILEQTPQYYGRAVASWSFTVGSPRFVDRSTMVTTPKLRGRDHLGIEQWSDVEVKRKGHQDAIAVANAHNPRRAADFTKLGQTIYFANGVDHGEGPYAAALEEGERLRRVNMPGQMVHQAIDVIRLKYSPVGATIRQAKGAVSRYYKKGEVMPLFHLTWKMKD